MPTELKKLVFEDHSVVISLRKLTALLYVCLGCSLLFRLGHEGVRFLGDTGLVCSRRLTYIDSAWC